jgi:hypothetical protein
MRAESVYMVEREKEEYVDLQCFCEKHRPAAEAGGKKKRRRREIKW